MSEGDDQNSSTPLSLEEYTRLQQQMSAIELSLRQNSPDQTNHTTSPTQQTSAPSRKLPGHRVPDLRAEFLASRAGRSSGADGRHVQLPATVHPSPLPALPATVQSPLGGARVHPSVGNNTRPGANSSAGSGAGAGAAGDGFGNTIGASDADTPLFSDPTGASPSSVTASGPAGPSSPPAAPSDPRPPKHQVKLPRNVPNTPSAPSRRAFAGLRAVRGPSLAGTGGPSPGTSGAPAHSQAWQGKESSGVGDDAKNGTDGTAAQSLRATVHSARGQGINFCMLEKAARRTVLRDIEAMDAYLLDMEEVLLSTFSKFGIRVSVDATVRMTLTELSALQTRVVRRLHGHLVSLHSERGEAADQLAQVRQQCAREVSKVRQMCSDRLQRMRQVQAKSDSAMEALRARHKAVVRDCRTFKTRCQELEHSIDDLTHQLKHPSVLAAPGNNVRPRGSPGQSHSVRLPEEEVHNGGDRGKNGAGVSANGGSGRPLTGSPQRDGSPVTRRSPSATAKFLAAEIRRLQMEGAVGRRVRLRELERCRDEVKQLQVQCARETTQRRHTHQALQDTRVALVEAQARAEEASGQCARLQGELDAARTAATHQKAELLQKFQRQVEVDTADKTEWKAKAGEFQRKYEALRLQTSTQIRLQCDKLNAAHAQQLDKLYERIRGIVSKKDQRIQSLSASLRRYQEQITSFIDQTEPPPAPPGPVKEVVVVVPMNEEQTVPRAVEGNVNDAVDGGR